MSTRQSRADTVIRIFRLPYPNPSPVRDTARAQMRLLTKRLDEAITIRNRHS